MIVMLLTTKDEGDVLELNLKHHLAWGVDHVGVADNESSDGTRERLRQFGDRVTTEVFDDFAERQHVRMRLLARIQEKLGGRVAWAGVSDTDEFFWRHGAASMKDVLAEAPADVVCATFHQKLFLPTESDPPEGPVYVRQTWRTTSYESPLHTSWHSGKSFYRTAWLGEIMHEHREPSVPHPAWGPADPVVHHYMIRDEDQFVMKVKRLTAWQPQAGLASKRWLRRAKDKAGLSRPHVSGFKMEWWMAYEKGGEPGLREYYRTKYRVQAADLARHEAAGHLVRDTSFRDFRVGIDATARAQ